MPPDGVVPAREVKGTNASTAHYYVTSLRGTAGQLAGLVRRHWAVENELHWCLDGKRPVTGRLA
ncbi:MAG: hypothetical protein U0871_01290 [Gemmataceae bacterium]